MDLLSETDVSHAYLQRARLVSREAWGAEVPSGKDDRLDGIISQVVFTYTGEACHRREECARAVRQLQRHHMDHGRFDLPYSFVLGGDGNTYVGRGWRRVPILPPMAGGDCHRTLVFARLGPITGGFVQDFEGAHYIIRFCQRERFTTDKLDVKRVFHDWNVY